MTSAFALMVLSSPIFSSEILAMPMRPSYSSALGSSRPTLTSTAVSGQSHLPSLSEHLYSSGAASSSGHSDLPPDAMKGKKPPRPQALYFDPNANHIVGAGGRKVDPADKGPRRLVYSSLLHKMVEDTAPSTSTTKARTSLPCRPSSGSWKDRYPGQIMTMAEVLARHIKRNKVTAHRHLSKYGNDEIAKGLLSHNEQLQREAVAKMPAIYRKPKDESPRIRYLGKQAEEITEKIRSQFNIQRKHAVEKLGRSLTPPIAILLKNPATFEVGARMLRARPYSKRQARVSGKGHNASDPVLVPSESSAAPSAIAQKSSPVQQQPRLQTHEHHQQHVQSPQRSPLHHSMNIVESSMFADDLDHIDFDAVMEWVQRTNHERSSGDHAKKSRD